MCSVQLAFLRIILCRIFLSSLILRLELFSKFFLSNPSPPKLRLTRFGMWRYAYFYTFTDFWRKSLPPSSPGHIIFGSKLLLNVGTSYQPTSNRIPEEWAVHQHRRASFTSSVTGGLSTDRPSAFCLAGPAHHGIGLFPAYELQ